jgi:hypothetical protein
MITKTEKAAVRPENLIYTAVNLMFEESKEGENILRSVFNVILMIC